MYVILNGRVGVFIDGAQSGEDQATGRDSEVAGSIRGISGTSGDRAVVIGSKPKLLGVKTISTDAKRSKMKLDDVTVAVQVKTK